MFNKGFAGVMVVGRRRRNACLAAIEQMRRHGDFALSDVVAFLYICENEGVNISELAQLAGLSASTASRVARRLAAADAPLALPPHFGLVELKPLASDLRGRVLFLLPRGKELRDEVDTLIRLGQPILLDPAQRVPAIYKNP